VVLTPYNQHAAIARVAARAATVVAIGLMDNNLSNL
jgi:hypothetical protein